MPPGERKASVSSAIGKPELRKPSLAQELGRLFLRRQKDQGSTDSGSSGGSTPVTRQPPINLVTAKKKHVYW
ncbi:unnamed protein product, partial [Mesorhabditis belari]|uniref:Uncharacterized protein n=1 Tax=Mesorhabditis belari TaxID=2138241 RepID=A0AAF3JAB0_9BILA